MKTKSFLPGLGGAVLIGCIVACSDSTSPGGGSTTAFDAQVTNDIAPTAAQDVSSEALLYNNVSNSSYSGSFAMASFGASLPMGHSTVSGAPWIDRSGCRLDHTGVRFFCNRFPWGLGDSASVSYQVFKTDTTTDSVEFSIMDTSDVAFSFGSWQLADTAGRDINATLILRDSVHVWNATGTGNINTVLVRPNDSTVYTVTGTDTASGVTFYVTHNGHHRYPVAGQIIRNYTVTLLRQGKNSTHRTTTRRVVVTFDSTATPTMTVNGNTAFSFNLATPQTVTKQ